MAHEGDITFSFNIHRELCTLSKSGGMPISIEKVLQCAQIASIQSQKITKIMKEALIKPT
jgi:exosome complex component RRP45